MTYKEIVDKIAFICNQHYIVQDFGYGALTDIKTVNDDGTQRVNYPYVFLNPTQSARTGQSITYRFNLIAMDVCEEEQGYSNWLEVQSSCQQYIDDILAQLRFGKPLLNADLTLNVNLTPFKERFQDTLAGMTATLEIEVPNKLNDCIVPIDQLVPIKAGLGYPYDGNFYPYSLEPAAIGNVFCGLWTGSFPQNPGDKTLPLEGWQYLDLFVKEGDINLDTQYGTGSFENGTQLYTADGLPYIPDNNLVDPFSEVQLLTINRLDIQSVATQQSTIAGLGSCCDPLIEPNIFPNGVLQLDKNTGLLNNYGWGYITDNC